MSRIKRLLLLDWDAIATLVAAVAAVVLHLLHLVEINVLLTISTVLVAGLFIRHLRRERAIEQALSSIHRILDKAEATSAVLASLKGDLLDLRTSRGRPTVHVYLSRSEVYEAIATLLDRIQDAPGEKQLALAALLGHSGERTNDEQQVLCEFEAFNAAMRRCIETPGSSWRVRHVYNITTAERLDAIRERLAATGDADGFEVRALSQREATPQLATLVAGPEDLFVAIEDPRFYRVQKAIHIRSRDGVEVAMQYFEALWQHKQMFFLRSADRIRSDEIDRLRKHINDGGAASNKRVNPPAGAPSPR